MTGRLERADEVPERLESIVSFSVEVEHSLISDSDPDGVRLLLPCHFLCLLEPATLAAAAVGNLGHFAEVCDW